MASIYEKPPHFVLEKTWDKKTRLPKTYKLQSSDSWNKIKAKVHQGSGKLGVEFTIDKTIPEFKKGAKKVNLDYAHFFMEFKNVLQGQYKTAWKQVIHEHFPELTDPENVPVKQDRSSEANFRPAVELFITKVLHEKKPRDWQYFYMLPGGDHNVQKKIEMSPLDQLHWWEEMMHVAGLLPEGNLPMPNKQLQVEWFYMTFHKSDCMEYMQTGRKLSNVMLQTVAEYFQLIHETRENDGGLTRHQIKNIQAKVKRELRPELAEQLGHNCAFSPTSIGATGHTINATVATIIVSMANTSSASSAMTAVAAMANAMTGRVPPSAKTRTSSPVASMASTPSTCTKSAVPTHGMKWNCTQTTTSAGTKVAIITTTATQVATMSCTGALILPCPATATQAQATRAKPRRIFT
jgi:hypothetical protein